VFPTINGRDPNVNDLGLPMVDARLRNGWDRTGDLSPNQQSL